MCSKLFIIITIVILSFCTKGLAQLATPPAPDLQEKAAGFELVKASRHFYTGAIIIGCGSVLDVIGAVQSLNAPTNSSAGGGFVVLGDLAVLTGFVFILESYGHIGRAGKILMQRNDLTFGQTPNGVGLSIHF